MQVYTLHQGRPQEEKEVFYQDLQDALDRTGDIDKIIMGAIHVHVGSARDNVGSLTHSE